jgi:hypothetical protein
LSALGEERFGVGVEFVGFVAEVTELFAAQRP